MLAMKTTKFLFLLRILSIIFCSIMDIIGIWRRSFVICWNMYLKNMAGLLEEQNTIMPLIATVTEAKKDSCIFIPGLSVTVRRLLLLKCSHLNCQQQATSDSKLTGDLAATTNAAKVRVSPTSEWT